MGTKLWKAVTAPECPSMPSPQWHDKFFPLLAQSHFPYPMMHYDDSFIVNLTASREVQRASGTSSEYVLLRMFKKEKIFLKKITWISGLCKENRPSSIWETIIQSTKDTDEKRRKDELSSWRKSHLLSSDHKMLGS